MSVAVQTGASFQSGVPQRLFNTLTLNQWTVSASGDRFLVMRPTVSEGPPPPFTIVLNWMGKLTQ
jgi:hypothetical protein